MHWFGELLAFYALIAVAIGIPAEIRLMKVLRLRYKNERLAYTRSSAWVRAWRALEAANDSAITALSAGDAPGFPEDIREQMLAAHGLAGEITKGIAHE
jgi:hypothetical protein